MLVNPSGEMLIFFDLLVMHKVILSEISSTQTITDNGDYIRKIFC